MLTDYFEDCELLHVSHTPDGLGGQVHTQAPGRAFRAGIHAVSSAEATIAGRVGAKAIYTVTTLPDVTLCQHDVILRKRDGRRYRITGNAADNTTPSVATVQYRQVSAEVIT